MTPLILYHRISHFPYMLLILLNFTPNSLKYTIRWARDLFVSMSMYRKVMCVMLLTEHVYNLREENKQLRNAHREIHTQLQDAQVRRTQRFIFKIVLSNYTISKYLAWLTTFSLALKICWHDCRVCLALNASVLLCVQLKHQNLKAVHDQLALTLEDHKSALAAAQVGKLWYSPVVFQSHNTQAD